MDAIGLIDCNNFYASCERVFDARIKQKPVVVLSNNDGCVIARSQEAKDLGIPMGAPKFRYESFFEENEVEVYSSNYELYGDMSDRVMTALRDFTPDVEVYSIDEAFLGLNQSKKSFAYLGKLIQEKIYKWIGIPVGVGIAETKTLAKIANKIAKKSEKAKGVLDLYKSPYQDVALDRTSIGDVWGIGPASVRKLETINVKTALQFKHCDLRWVKKNFTVVGGRTLLELRGIKCLPLELAPPPKKSITCSRSFGEPVTEYKEIYHAVSTFLMRAAEKMRRHKLAAQSITVFCSTNRFQPETFYSANKTYASAYPSDDYFELQKWTTQTLREIYREGRLYKNAGIILGGLIPTEGISSRLYEEERVNPKFERLNRAIDEINRKFGRDTVCLAAAAVKGKWQMKSEKRSPRYTTKLAEILSVG